jgi:hypothetical protein
MYDPINSEHYNEWIELYNPYPYPINLSNWTLCNNKLLEGFINKTDGNTYQTNGLIIQENSYAIITDGNTGTEVYNNFNIPPNTTSLHVNSSSICTGLSNTQDIIFLKDQNNTLIDAISYTSDWGANNNGKTLCKPNNIQPWKECNPSPGSKNTETLNYNLEITEFLPDPEGNDSANMPDGEWIELYNKGDTELNLNGLYFKDNANHILTISSTTTYNTTLMPKQYIVIYTNGFSGFLNNNGFEKISLYSDSLLIDEVTYSFSEEGTSWSKLNGIWKLTKPSPGKENYQEDEGKESTIKIIKISPKNIKFGQTLSLKLEVYKGDETKNTIQAYIKEPNTNTKISKITKFNIEKRYSESTLTIPIQILPNCKNKFPNGLYKIIIKGLNTEATKKINIQNTTKDLCQTQKIKETIIKPKSETIINNTTNQTLSYESASEKSDRLSIYLFVLTLLLLLIKLRKWKN